MLLGFLKKESAPWIAVTFASACDAKVSLQAPPQEEEEAVLAKWKAGVYGYSNFPLPETNC
jgi:hypothetical protein